MIKNNQRGKYRFIPMLYFYTDWIVKKKIWLVNDGRIGFGQQHVLDKSIAIQFPMKKLIFCYSPKFRKNLNHFDSWTKSVSQAFFLKQTNCDC